MPNTETPVGVQTDTLVTNPIPVRMVTVNAIINGVASSVQMQVISLADENGVIVGQPYEPRQLLADILNVMKDIRIMMSKLSEMPFVDNQEGRIDPPGVGS